MSVQALGWVLDHSPAQGSDRLVLLSIANHAGQAPEDGAWTAWPGVATMQREARLERTRTVQDALRRLTDAGHLARVINGAPDERIPKHRRPNLYRILLANGVTCGVIPCRGCGMTPDAERGDATASDGVTFRDRMGCRQTSPKPSEEPSGEPSLEPTLALALPDAERKKPPGHKYSPLFERWWLLVPSSVKVDKPAAFAAFKKACRIVGDEVLFRQMAAWGNYWEAAGTEKIPYPATWLNKGRYETNPPAVVRPDGRSARDRSGDDALARLVSNGRTGSIDTTATPLDLLAINQPKENR